MPTYPGAIELSSSGVRPSLFEANKAIVDGALVAQADGAKSALLFDPQTSGGLLAAVDPAMASGLVSELQEKGFDAAVIGAVTDTIGQITVID